MIDRIGGGTPGRMTSGVNAVRRRSSLLLGGGILLALVGGPLGCARHTGNALPMSPVGNVDEARAQAESSDFDRVRDPAINADTRYAAGQLAESQKAYTRAAEQYRAALKLNPEHVPSLYRMGVLYAQFKQYDDAIATWERYIRATREAAVGYSNLGFCYELAGQPGMAEQTYLKGIQRDSASGPCRVNYGLMLARHGRTNEAILQLQSVLSPAEVHYNLASVYEGLGKSAEAKLEYRKAIELDPRLADARQRLAALE